MPSGPFGWQGVPEIAEHEEKGAPVLRAEYLWSGGKVAGLRSSPA